MTYGVEDQHRDYYPGFPRPLEQMCRGSIYVSHIPDLYH